MTFDSRDRGGGGSKWYSQAVLGRGEGESERYSQVVLGRGEGELERYSPIDKALGKEEERCSPADKAAVELAVGLAVAEEGKIGTALVEDVLRRPVAMGYLPGPHLPVLGLWKSLSLFEHRLRWSVDSLVSHGYCPC